MKNYTQFLLIIFLFILIPSWTISQEKAENSLSGEEIQRYKKQISFLVNYLQGTLNFLGDPESVAKEKEVIINESYLKIFKNDKVQVEDDLDDGREVPLHKDVQAYLKDIEFFFRAVKFEFVIVDINHFVNNDDIHYFKVAFNRDMEGVTLTGDTVQSRKLRYMEVNLDLAKNDLRIASIYTTKLNEKEEIRNWWNKMNMDWKEIFGKDVLIGDSIRLSDIRFIGDSLIVVSVNNDSIPVDSMVTYDIEFPAERRSGLGVSFAGDTIYMDTKAVFTTLYGILNLQSIDVSFNEEIRTLDPLAELSELREVNCSNTLVVSLFPLRNLNQMEILNCSETPVEDISPIQYTISVKELNCSYTLVDDLSSIKGLTNIEKLECAGNRIENLEFVENLLSIDFLDCSHSQIYDLEPVSNLKQLETLDISGTRVQDLKSLSGLTKLTYLNGESSSIVSLDDLRDLENLEVLYISRTQVSSLDPLNELKNLKKIYCDDTEIDKDQTIRFMRSHPGCLVVFASEELLTGWSELNDTWKQIAYEIADLSENPTKEELHELIKAEILDLSGKQGITSLELVKRLYNLKNLNLSFIKVEDYSPVGDAIELEELNLSNTHVSDLYFVENLTRLEVLNIESTAVKSLESLSDLDNLKIIYADSSGIGDSEAFLLREKNPECLIVYKSKELQTWWQNMSSSWKDYFFSSYKISATPDREQLHQLLYLDSIRVNGNNQIDNLQPLSMIRGLRSLIINGTRVNDLTPLKTLNNLKLLYCSQNPISDLTSISGLNTLEYLDIANTTVGDLKPLASLTDIRSFDCSGTQVKNIGPLENLVKLERLALNNTSIKSLKPLLKLENLSYISCFNTRISSKNIDKFKETKPDVEMIFY